LALRLRLSNQRQRVRQVAGLGLQITGSQTFVDALLIHFHHQNGGTGQNAGQGLRPAHAAQSGRQHKATQQAVVEMALGDAAKNFVSALNDALAANVLPGAGR